SARLEVEYSTTDGWIRGTATTATLGAGTPVSDRFPLPTGDRNSYPLYTGAMHDWGPDLIDGFVTLGISNQPGGDGGPSVVRFYGVEHSSSPTLATRPSLDLVICNN